MALRPGGRWWAIFYLMELIDKTVVEYSPSQKCIHIQTAAGMLSDNVRVLKGLSISDYIPIGFFNNYKEAVRFLKPVYRFLNQSEINY